MIRRHGWVPRSSPRRRRVGSPHHLVVLAVTMLTLAGSFYLPTASVDAVGTATLSGYVRMPGGSDVSGTRVMVVADAPGPATTVPLVLVGETTVGPDGRFALSLVPNDTTTALVNAAGALNVTVVALLEQGQKRSSALYAIPLSVKGDTFAAVADPVVLDLEPLAVSTAASCAPPPAVTASCCPVVPLLPLTKSPIGDPQFAPTTVGELHAWDDMTSSFIYEQGGEHKIDIGVSADGGSYRFGGARSVTKEASSSQGPEGLKGRYGFTQRPTIRYQKYAWCLAGSSGNVKYTVEAEYPSGGFGPSQDVSSKDGPGPFLRNDRPGKMGEFRPTDTYEKVSGVSERFESAAEVFGFKVGAISHYSEKLKFTWLMGSQFGSPTDPQYHLWGDGEDLRSSRTVYAYSGPDPVVAISPLVQTTDAAGRGRWTVSVAQDPRRPTTLHFTYGDGASETRSVPQGSGVSNFGFFRYFNAAGTYDQRATVMETEISHDSKTTRVCSIATPCFTISQPEIEAKWREHGGSDGFLGAPTSNTNNTGCGGGKYNNFEGGAITWRHI